MTDRDIEMKIRAAVEKTAPDGLERLLSDIENGKGALKMNKKKNRWIGLAAACLALALIAGAGGIYYRQNYAVATVVSLDVNPSVELRVNRAEKVLACRGLNDEGREILASMDGGADLEGAKLNVAVNAIVGAIVKAGYLDSLNSAILISVEDKDTQRGARLQAQLVAEVDGVLETAANSAGVLSQSITTDAGLDKQAQDYNISAGKAALVNQVIALNPDLEFEKLAELSVEELRDLIKIGAPGMPIGRTQAMLIASEYAGVMAIDSVVPEVDPELDDAIPHYEVELTWGDRTREYDYMIDAFTGEVLSGQADVVSTSTTPVTPNTPTTSENPTTPATPDVTGIGVEAAKAAALKHAGLTADQVTFEKAEKDYDNGKTVYEVDFYTADTEYDYEIDAATGEVIKAEKEPRTGTQAPSTPSTPATTDIGVEAAKAAALKHAGVSADKVTYWEKTGKDYDNGRLEYEIDFSTANAEYDYEIDAATGEIIRYETTEICSLPPAPSETVTDIDEDAAKAAALQRAGITDAGSVTWIKCQREYDDGRLQYDMEFEVGATVHECEVLAADCTVLSYGTEPCDNALHHHEDAGHDDHDDTHHSDTHHTGTQTTDIGADAAKVAAIAHAGLTESQVTGLKCERDYDDGRLVYEVEFKSGGYEYDYKIDASTGSVLEHERDFDD